MVLKLRSSLAEAVDSKTSTELETSRALRKTLERVKRLVKKVGILLGLNFQIHFFFSFSVFSFTYVDLFIFLIYFV